MSLLNSLLSASASCVFAAALLGLAPAAVTDGEASDSENWTVVYSDKFDRDKPGDRWQVAHGEWTIADGALKGQLRKHDNPGFEYHDADIVLKDVALPSTVEVRYETWSPDELGSEAKFLTEAGDAGIIVAFLGVEHPAYQTKGALLLTETPEPSYRLVGKAPTAELTPKEHHKVRLLRKGDRITLYLDGRELYSAGVGTAKDLGDLKLHLVGTWGKEGSVVYFDNLEVRVPPEQPK